MTIDTINRRLKKIQEHAARGDHEAAHAEEDGLYGAFVAHVAVTAGSPLSLMAELVLRSSQIDFKRWCA